MPAMGRGWVPVVHGYLSPLLASVLVGYLLWFTTEKHDEL